jgi:hypothetical protein
VPGASWHRRDGAADAQAASYSKAEIDALLQGKVDSGVTTMIDGHRRGLVFLMQAGFAW